MWDKRLIKLNKKLRNVFKIKKKLPQIWRVKNLSNEYDSLLNDQTIPIFLQGTGVELSDWLLVGENITLAFLRITFCPIYFSVIPKFLASTSEAFKTAQWSHRSVKKYENAPLYCWLARCLCSIIKTYKFCPKIF